MILVRCKNKKYFIFIIFSQSKYINIAVNKFEWQTNHFMIQDF